MGRCEWQTDWAVWLRKESTNQAGKNAVAWRNKQTSGYTTVMCFPPSHLLSCSLLKNLNHNSVFICVFVLPVKHCWSVCVNWSHNTPFDLNDYLRWKKQCHFSPPANEEVVWQLWIYRLYEQKACVSAGESTSYTLSVLCGLNQEQHHTQSSLSSIHQLL